MCLLVEIFPNFLNFSSILLHFPHTFLSALHNNSGLADWAPHLVHHQPPHAPLDTLQHREEALHCHSTQLVQEIKMKGI